MLSVTYNLSQSHLVDNTRDIAKTRGMCEVLHLNKLAVAEMTQRAPEEY